MSAPTILDATTLAAVRAATSQEAQLAALAAPFITAGEVTVKTYAGATQLDVATYPEWEFDTDVPRGMTLSELAAYTPLATATPTEHRFYADGTEIFRMPAGVGGSGISFASGVMPSTARANLADAAGKMRITATASLLVNAYPEWRPPPGHLAVLSVANGLLENNFWDTVPDYFLAFYASKVNEYGGGIPNPFFGPYGCKIYLGGGHSSDSYNAVTALVHGYSQVRWQVLMPASPIFGDTAAFAAQNSTQQTLPEQEAINPYITWEYAEQLCAGDPPDSSRRFRMCSPHAYGCGTIRGPSEGGAACGTVEWVLHGAGTHHGFAGAECTHKLELTDTVGPFEMARITDTHGLYSGFPPVVVPAQLGGPFWEARIPGQDRTFYETGWSTMVVRWYNHTTDAYVQGTGTGRIPRLNDSTGAFREVPARNLNVFATAVTGNVLKIQYMDTLQAQPSWVTATLSQDILVENDYTSCAWDPDNEQLVVTQFLDDHTSYATIYIPADPTDEWTLTTGNFLGHTAGVPLTDYPFINRANKNWTYDERVGAICCPIIDQPNGIADKIYVFTPPVR